MSDGQETSSKARILIVENDTDMRDDTVRSLTLWGYEVVVADGIRATLLEDARKKVRDHRCLVVLLDMRLLDDRDPDDTSGLDLAPHLKPARIVMYSSYGDRGSVRRALQEEGVSAFVFKEEGPAQLRAAIDRVAQEMYACRNDTDIDWPVGLSSPEVMVRFFPNSLHLSPSEADDLLVRLFPAAKKINLRYLEDTPVAPSSAPRQRSIVLKAFVDDLEPLAVKFAQPDRIAKEEKNYHAHVEHKLWGSRYAQILRTATCWDLAATVYTFLGSSLNQMHSFSRYYTSATTTNQIAPVLDSIFEETWGRHYFNTRHPQTHSLFKEYSTVWEPKWHSRLAKFKNQEEFLFHRRYDVTLPNPVAWVARQVGLTGNSNGDASNVPRCFMAITHGDLLGDNVFVDDNRKGWFIDYERTSDGPILQDFTELETDVLVRLAEFGEEGDDPLVFFALLLALVTDKEFRSPPAAMRFRSYPEGQKAWGTIRNLRGLARKLTRVTDAQQYLWGLLFNAVFRVTIVEDDVQIERALLLGGLICHRLEHWKDNKWPPANWPSLPSKQPVATTVEPRQLYTVLDKHFSEDDLRMACFRLRVSYDDLHGSARGAKARELILYLERKNRLNELVRLIKKDHPHINLDDFLSDASRR